MAASGRGRFITLEGGEGVGKSTQAQLLLAHLKARGTPAIATREPGGSPGAEAIRDVLLSSAVPLGPAAEALLFSAARSDHLDRTIRPALGAGTWVVCDRFTDSTRAYQGVLGELDRHFITTLEELVVGDARPDLTLIIDAPAELGLTRAATRRSAGVGADRFEKQTLSFHQKLRLAFLAIAGAEPGRCAVIDGTADPGAVAASIAAVVDQRLPGPVGAAMPGSGPARATSPVTRQW